MRASTQPETIRYHEPATFFLCQSEHELRKRVAAIACWKSYRRDFDASPHAADALAALVALYLEAHDCTNALPLLRTFLAVHPWAMQTKAMQPLTKAVWHPISHFSPT